MSLVDRTDFATYPASLSPEESQEIPSLIRKISETTEAIFVVLRMATWGYGAVPKPQFYFIHSIDLIKDGEV